MCFVVFCFGSVCVGRSVNVSFLSWLLSFYCHSTIPTGHGGLGKVRRRSRNVETVRNHSYINRRGLTNAGVAYYNDTRRPASGILRLFLRTTASRTPSIQTYLDFSISISVKVCVCVDVSCQIPHSFLCWFGVTAFRLTNNTTVRHNLSHTVPEPTPHTLQSFARCSYQH
jgi:hypothetical protein